MQNGIFRGVLGCGSKYRDSILSFSLLRENLSPENLSVHILRIQFQDVVVGLRRVYRLMLHQQNLRVAAGDANILRMLGMQRGKFRRRFVQLPLAKIKIAE